MKKPSKPRASTSSGKTTLLTKASSPLLTTKKTTPQKDKIGEVSPTTTISSSRKGNGRSTGSGGRTRREQETHLKVLKLPYDKLVTIDSLAKYVKPVDTVKFVDS